MDKQHGAPSVPQICDDQTHFPVESSFVVDAFTQQQNMPEDCLLEIFSKKFGLMDFCSIAETCQLFRSVTQRLIGKIMWLHAHDESYAFYSPKFYHCTGKRIDVVRIFRNFGPCLLLVVIGQKHRFMLDLAINHCDEKLKYLDIRHIQINSILAQKLKPVLRQLKIFKLWSVSIEGNDSVFRKLNSLVELQIEDVENCISILVNTFPRLKLFSFNTASFSNHNDPSPATMSSTMSSFVTRHPALKSLAIHLECDRSNLMSILQAIGDNCTDLQDFNVGFFHKRKYLCNSLLPWQTLKSLTTLSLVFVSFEDFKALAPLTELRKIQWLKCILPRDVDEFTHLAQITEVSLEECESMGTYDVADIIRHLVNVVQLELLSLRFKGKEFNLNETEFSRIIDICKDRRHQLELTALCGYDQKTYFENKTVKLLGRR